MSNVVSITSRKQIPAVEPLDESGEAYMGGLDEGFDAGYAAGYRAATAKAAKFADKALNTLPRTGENLVHALAELRWNRCAGRRKFAGSTPAKRQFLESMKEWMGY